MKKIAALLMLIALSISLPHSVSSQYVVHYTHSSQGIVPIWFSTMIDHYQYELLARIQHPEEMRQHWLHAIEAAGIENAHKVTMRVGDDCIPYSVGEDGAVWFHTNEKLIYMGFYLAEDESHHPIFVRLNTDKLSYIRLRNIVVQTGVYYYDQHDHNLPNQ